MSKEILTEKDLAEINNALKTIDDTRIIINKAKQAGLDVVQYEKDLAEQEKKLRGIKQSFFAGR